MVKSQLVIPLEPCKRDVEAWRSHGGEEEGEEDVTVGPSMSCCCTHLCFCGCLQVTDNPAPHRCMYCWLVQLITLLLHLPCSIYEFLHRFVASSARCRDEQQVKFIEGITEHTHRITVEDFTQFWKAKDVAPKESSQYGMTLATAIQTWMKTKDVTMWRELDTELKEICQNSYERRLDIWLSQLSRLSDTADGNTLMTQLVFRVLLSNEPTMVEQTFREIQVQPQWYVTEGQCQGHSLLHVAVMQKNVAAIHGLLEPLTSTERYHAIHTKTGPCAVVAQYPVIQLPLNQAIWGGDLTTIKTLLFYGAELSEQDDKGYNAIHTLVLLAKENLPLALSLFEEIMTLIPTWVSLTNQHKKLRSMTERTGTIIAKEILFQAKTVNQCTPLKLAGKLGEAAMIEQILNVEGVYKFHSCQIGCKMKAFYDMSEIDPFLCDHTRAPSVLEATVLEPNDERLACLDIAPIRHLLNLKIQRYRPFLATSAVLHVTIMVLYSLGAFYWLFPRFQQDRNNGTTVHHPERFDLHSVDYMLVAAGTLYVLYTVLVLVHLTKIIRRHLLPLTSGFWLLNCVQVETQLMFGLSVLIYIILKLYNNSNEVLAMAFSIIVGWMHLFLYMRAFRATAFFSIMFARVLLSDVLRFLFIITVVVISYTMAASAIFADESDLDSTLVKPSSIIFNFIQLAMGLSDFSELVQSSFHNLGTMTLLYLSFVILANTLLFNLLIAAVNTSYSAISSQSRLLCLKVRTADIIVLQALMPLCVHQTLYRMYTQQTIVYNIPGQRRWRRKLYLISPPLQ